MERLNQWLALVANLGVVMGIVFLALEIQVNTQAIEESRKLTRADMERQLIQQYDQITYQASENREIASIMVRGLRDIESLEEDERRIFYSRIIAEWNFFMAQYRLARDGFISEEYASNNDSNILRFLENPGVNKLWSMVGPLYPASFREHVESLSHAAN